MHRCSARCRLSPAQTSNPALPNVFERRPIHECGQDIAGVVNAWDAVQTKVSLAEAVLHPEIGRRKVPDFAQAPATANSHCGGCISVYGNVPVQSEISSHRLQAKRRSSTLAYAAELCLGRAQSNSALCG